MGEAARLPDNAQCLHLQWVGLGLTLTVEVKDLDGEEIRLMRERLGLSRAELAARLGVTWPTVWRWETDRTKPQPGWLRALKTLADSAATTEEAA